MTRMKKLIFGETLLNEEMTVLATICVMRVNAEEDQDSDIKKIEKTASSDTTCTVNSRLHFFHKREAEGTEPIHMKICSRQIYGFTTKEENKRRLLPDL